MRRFERCVCRTWPLWVGVGAVPLLGMVGLMALISEVLLNFDANLVRFQVPGRKEMSLDGHCSCTIYHEYDSTLGRRSRSASPRQVKPQCKLWRADNPAEIIELRSMRSLATYSIDGRSGSCFTFICGPI